MTPSRRAEFDQAMKRANWGRPRKNETRKEKKARIKKELNDKWLKEDAEGVI